MRINPSQPYLRGYIPFPDKQTQTPTQDGQRECVWQPYTTRLHKQMATIKTPLQTAIGLHPKEELHC